uniref:Uncharacterized protein n=1 Tax=Sus scrofa TaxID=9823 RepID=A0A8D1QRV1_PIG
VIYILFASLFFSMGNSLHTNEAASGLVHAKMHLLMQVMQLSFFRYALWIYLQFLCFSPLNEYLLLGHQACGCGPSPRNSRIILLKGIIQGNEISSFFFFFFFSFLGPVITPALLMTTLGESSENPFTPLITQLHWEISVPLHIGQILRIYIQNWLEKKKKRFSAISNELLLWIMLTKFCSTFLKKSFNLIKFNLILFLYTTCSLLLSFFLFTYIFYTRNNSNFMPAATAPKMFCSYHRTLALGVPAIKDVF